MKRKLLPAVLVLTAVAPAFAQRDFLTSDEVEKVRDTQEPNARLKLYVLFARQRIDQFQQLLKKDRKGRSLEARELLEDYTNILDELNNVSDDALKRHVPVQDGLAAVSDAEKRFLVQLQKVEASPPADLDAYDVAFKEAIAATSDSLDLAGADTGQRAAELRAEDRAEKNKAESVLRAEGVKPNEAAAQGQSADGKPARKPPTLMRPGEKAPD